jgi:hypothetical protein
MRIGTQIAVDEPTNSSWLSIEGDTERDLDPDTMTQFVVNIQVPENCPSGKYSYRLRVFDPENPGERFVDGEKVFFEVKKEKPVPPPSPGPKRHWILYAAAALVAVAVIGIAIVMFTGKTEVKVPTLEEMTLYDALKEINSSKLKFHAETGLLERTVTSAEEHGKVVDQDPKENTMVPENTEVKIWVGTRTRIKVIDLLTVNQQKQLETMKHVVMPKRLMSRSLGPEPESN